MIRPQDIVEGVRLLTSLPGFLRTPITLDEARRTLAHRLKRRGDHFLDLARTAIFRQPSSLYRRLFEVAGCEYGDLEAMVRREGADAALRSLARHGVYLTVDEFKGRCPIVR